MWSKQTCFLSGLVGRKGPIQIGRFPANGGMHPLDWSPSFATYVRVSFTMGKDPGRKTA